MNKVLGVILIFLSATSFAYISPTAEPIQCPGAKECFDCWAGRVAPSRVLFEFTRAPNVPGHDWTPIEMVASTSTPIRNVQKESPDLEVILPIQLYKLNNGDFLVVCHYSDSGKYGGHVGYTPRTTLTIKAHEAKTCVVKEDKATVLCI